MEWGDLTMRERQELYRAARSASPGVSYFDVKDMTINHDPSLPRDNTNVVIPDSYTGKADSSNFITRAIDRIKDNFITPLVDDLKSGDLMNYIDIPQKILMYGATSLSRFPFDGYGGGKYGTPGQIMREDWGNNNTAVQSIADYAIDPLAAFPMEKLRYGINLSKTAKHGKLLNPWARNRNIFRQSVELLDTTNDVYENYKANNE